MRPTAGALAAAGYLAENHPGPMVLHKSESLARLAAGTLPIASAKPPEQANRSPVAQITTTGSAAVSYTRMGNGYRSVGLRFLTKSALTNPGWTCATVQVHHGNYYCTELDVNPPGVNGSLSDRNTISQAISATETAVSVQQNYGFASYSGCTEPQTFFSTVVDLAGQPSGATCIAFDQAGTIWVSVADPVTYPGSVVTTVAKSSWAAELPNGTAVLCSGASPSGNCP